jgi:peptide/nickel transport system ATP-binding protein
MYHGEIVEWGAAEQVTTNPQHPYTQRLFLAAPVPHPKLQATRRMERHRLLARQNRESTSTVNIAV